MFRKPLTIHAMLSVWAILLLAGLSTGQPMSMKPTPTPTPLSAPTGGTTPQPKGAAERLRPTAGVISQSSKATTDWDGKVQGKLIVTPVTLRFQSAVDYANFVAGKLPVNLLLKSLRSGAWSKTNGDSLVRGFNPGRSKDEITVFVVIDNLSQPLGDWERCIDTQLGAELSREGSGVNLTLTYGGCPGPDSSGSGPPAQRPGNPIGGLIVHGGKSLSGDLNIGAGPSQIVTHAAAAAIGHGPNETTFFSGKGSGSPKQADF